MFFPQIHTIRVERNVAQEHIEKVVNAEVTRFVKELTNISPKLPLKLSRIDERSYELTYFSEIGYEIPRGFVLYGADSLGERGNSKAEPQVSGGVKRLS